MFRRPLLVVALVACGGSSAAGIDEVPSVPGNVPGTDAAASSGSSSSSSSSSSGAFEDASGKPEPLVDAGADVDAGDNGQTSHGLASACPNGVNECDSYSAAGASKSSGATCYPKHVAADVSPTDMYQRCTFLCDSSPDFGVVDPKLEKLCEAYGGTCKLPAFGQRPICFPN